MKKSKKESTRKREIVRDGKSRGRTEREREREESGRKLPLQRLPQKESPSQGTLKIFFQVLII